MSDLSVRQFLRRNRFDPTTSIRHLLSSTSENSVRHLLTTFVLSNDRLLPYQQLKVNDQLISGNGMVDLDMQGDGDLVLYRTHFGQALWKTGTGLPVNRVIMQGDGDLVAYPEQHTPYWDSGTGGHPGASVLLQDDGNLVILDKTNNRLWASNTVQDFSSPTFGYSDANGYAYVETSERWKDLCSVLPCFAGLEWPDYATNTVSDTINGRPVVIQLWKGWCPKFLGLDNFPGGVGGEVGIYEKVSHHELPSDLSFLPSTLRAMILAALELSDDMLWWPITDTAYLRDLEIDFELINPETGQTFFEAGPEKNTYWLNKWMSDDSYSRYQRGTSTPTFSVDYTLRCNISGNEYIWK